MAVSAEYKAAQERLDRETSEAAEEFRKLRDSLSTSMTPEEVTNAQNFLTQISDRLDGMAKPDVTPPEEPVPTLESARRK